MMDYLTTTIRLVALREQYEQLKPRIDAAIASVIDRSAYIAGPEVADFEQWFAVHSIVTDSKGNLYTTETYEGKRVQKFVYKGLAPVTRANQGVLWPGSR